MPAFLFSDRLAGPCRSVVIFNQLEICLRMFTDRANFQRFLPFVDMTAVAAFPCGGVVLRKEPAGFDLLQQLEVAFLVRLLYLADPLENKGDVVETLIPGILGHAWIHIGMLFKLAG